MPIPTVFKFFAFFLCALNRVFSETGPNSIFATSDNNIALSLTFLIGSDFIVSIFV